MTNHFKTTNPRTIMQSQNKLIIAPIAVCTTQNLTRTTCSDYLWQIQPLTKQTEICKLPCTWRTPRLLGNTVKHQAMVINHAQLLQIMVLQTKCAVLSLASHVVNTPSVRCSGLCISCSSTQQVHNNPQM